MDSCHAVDWFLLIHLMQFCLLGKMKPYQWRYARSFLPPLLVSLSSLLFISLLFYSRSSNLRYRLSFLALSRHFSRDLISDFSSLVFHFFSILSLIRFFFLPFYLSINLFICIFFNGGFILISFFLIFSRFPNFVFSFGTKKKWLRWFFSFFLGRGNVLVFGFYFLLFFVRLVCFFVLFFAFFFFCTALIYLFFFSFSNPIFC